MKMFMHDQKTSYSIIIAHIVQFTYTYSVINIYWSECHMQVALIYIPQIAIQDFNYAYDFSKTEKVNNPPVHFIYFKSSVQPNAVVIRI